MTKLSPVPDQTYQKIPGGYQVVQEDSSITQRLMDTSRGIEQFDGTFLDVGLGDEMQVRGSLVQTVRNKESFTFHALQVRLTGVLPVTLTEILANGVNILAESVVIEDTDPVTVELTDTEFYLRRNSSLAITTVEVPDPLDEAFIGFVS